MYHVAKHSASLRVFFLCSHVTLPCSVIVCQLEQFPAACPVQNHSSQNYQSSNHVSNTWQLRVLQTTALPEGQKTFHTFNTTGEKRLGPTFKAQRKKTGGQREKVRQQVETDSDRKKKKEKDREKVATGRRRTTLLDWTGLESNTH